MAKILLVEDDNNLREIYEARLQAEGYDIVSAKDGEEALVIAKKERPDLIIADVMMPRVSGFEMLDILRNTPELKDVHVIMLTALGQAEDKTRADSLGADRYLVKSQVTLEDIVKAAADVLAGAPAATPAITAAAADGVQATTAAPSPAAVPITPVTPTPPVVSAPAPAPDVAAIAVPTTPALPPVDLSTPQPAVPASGTPIPVTTIPDTTLPPVAQPPVQQPSAMPTAVQSTAQADTTTALPEPTATDAKLMTDAVNNLVAGSPQDITTPAPTAVTPIQDIAAPQPAQAPAAPVAPAPPLTMQPIITSPAPPTPVTNDAEPIGRKAIQPLAPDAGTSTPDLNDLMAKEGHSLDENDLPQIFSGSHMPGNVISPGANDQTQPPSSPAPTDPNSISL